MVTCVVFCVGFVFWSSSLRSHVVRHGVCASVRYQAFTVAILAQGTNRGDALCAALLLNRVASIPHKNTFSFSFCFCVELLLSLRRCVCFDKNIDLRKAATCAECRAERASFFLFFLSRLKNVDTVFCLCARSFAFLRLQKAYSTRRFSRAVPHHGTCRALTGLTSEFRWDRVYS